MTGLTLELVDTLVQRFHAGKTALCSGITVEPVVCWPASSISGRSHLIFSTHEEFVASSIFWTDLA